MQAAHSHLSLVDKIRSDFEPEFNFKKGSAFSWSSSESTIYYSTAKSVSENTVWSLLHEIGHAKLGHKQYQDDLELLMMEVSAWRKAKELATYYHLVIDQHHIEECLDSYRDWLHNRSRCIECKMHSFQTDQTTYECYNCYAKWQVPASRMCVVRKRRLA